MKNCIYPIGDRKPEFLTYSSLPQPSTPPGKISSCIIVITYQGTRRHTPQSIQSDFPSLENLMTECLLFKVLGQNIRQNFTNSPRLMST